MVDPSIIIIPFFQFTRVLQQLHQRHTWSKWKPDEDHSSHPKSTKDKCPEFKTERGLNPLPLLSFNAAFSFPSTFSSPLEL